VSTGVGLGILLATVVGMEAAAALIHRFVMHGPGWAWHRSHHEKHDDLLEKNDLYAVIFAVIACALLFLNATASPWWWIGLGMTVYGFLYFVVHDGLVHQRWPFRYTPRRGYLRRLVQAHRLHHAVEGREGCVSFGFLYAPPVRRLAETLRRRHGRAPSAEAGE
jgi:beta-carotene 3-hydroxylase